MKKTEKGDLFQNDVAEIFKLLGFNVKVDIKINNRQIDIYLEQKNGLTKYKSIVECKYMKKGVIGVNIIENFSNIVLNLRHSNKIDRGYLITTNGFTNNAKNKAKKFGIELFTYNELLNEIINFSNYIKTIISDYENIDEIKYHKIPIFEDLNRFNIKKYYIQLNGIDQNGIKYIPLKKLMDKWIQNPKKTLLAILGDYGTGKTSFCLNLTYRIAKKYKRDPLKNPIPLFISLNNYLDFKNIYQFIIDALEKYEVKVKNQESLNKYFKSRKIILIFDSYDELGIQIDKRTEFKLLRELIKLADSGVKLIIACRTSYFKSQYQMYETFLLDNIETSHIEKYLKRFYFIELLEFNKNQIRCVLLKYFSNYDGRLCDDCNRQLNWNENCKYYWNENCEKYWNIILKTFDLPDLAKRPILLNMIIKTLPNLPKIKRRIFSSTIYEKYTEMIFQYKKWLSMLPKKEKTGLMLEIAYYLYINRRNKIPREILEDIIRNKLKKEFFSIIDLNLFYKEIRSRSLLNRDKDGNYKFIHQSFMEFFVAKKIYNDILIGYYESLISRYVPKKIVIFLAELFMENGIEPLINAIKTSNNQNFIKNAALILGLIDDEDIINLTLELLDFNQPISIACCVAEALRLRGRNDLFESFLLNVEKYQLKDRSDTTNEDYDLLIDTGTIETINLNNANIIPKLIKIFNKSKNRHIRRQIIFQLCRIKDDRSLPLLREVAKKSEDIRMRRYAIRGLSRFNDKLVFDIYIKIINEEGESILLYDIIRSITELISKRKISFDEFKKKFNNKIKNESFWKKFGKTSNYNEILF